MLGDSSVVPRVLLGGSGVVSIKWRNSCYQAVQPMVAVLLILLTSPSLSFLSS